MKPVLALCGLLRVLAYAHADSLAELRDWQRVASEIVTREWAVAEDGGTFPVAPVVLVRADDSVNAYARAGTDQRPPEIVVFAGLIRGLALVDGRLDRDALACVLGHEVAHLTLGHHGQRAGADRVKLARDPTIAAGLAREDELAADLVGTKLAVRAGYDPTGLLRLFERSRRQMGDSATWELYGADHPTVTQRLLALDADHAALWRAALDFEVGVDLLRGGNYSCAQECFRSARERFPQSPEVACNLGYALLVECYHRLPPEHWQAYGLGQLVPPGFARFLPVAPRRTRTPEEMDELRRIWREAMGLLESAREAPGVRALALSNIGFALLICPDGPLAGRACSALEDARSAPGDDQADDVTRLAAANWNNLGAAWWLSGDEARALRCFQQAAQDDGTRRPLAAPDINASLLTASRHGAEGRKNALEKLEALLPSMARRDGDWEHVYARYRTECLDAGRSPLDETALAPRRTRHASLHLEAHGGRLFLGDSGARVWRKLGKPDVTVPVGPGSGADRDRLVCWIYRSPGIELVLLQGMVVRVRAVHAEAGSRARLVRSAAGTSLCVGDPVEALVKFIGREYDDVMRIGDGRPHRVYSRERLAVRIEDGAVTSIALAGLSDSPSP